MPPARVGDTRRVVAGRREPAVRVVVPREDASGGPLRGGVTLRRFSARCYTCQTYRTLTVRRQGRVHEPAVGETSKCLMRGIVTGSPALSVDAAVRDGREQPWEGETEPWLPTAGTQLAGHGRPQL